MESLTISGVTYEWVDGPFCEDQQWAQVDALLATRGWNSLNRATTRILLAKNEEGKVLGFNVFQLYPFQGPLYVVPSARGTGVAQELVDQMVLFMASIGIRGYIAVAQSPHSVKMCEQMGMTKITDPIYIAGGEL